LNAPELVITAAPLTGGARGFLRAGAAAGMHQHDRLLARAGARRLRKKQRRVAHLLHEQHDDFGRVVVDEKREKIFRRELRFVAGGDDDGELELLREQSQPQGRAHGAALGDDADATSLDLRWQGQGLECQCHPVGQIDQADAIRPAQRQLRLVGDPRYLFLLGAPGFVHLGKARGEHQRGADLAADAGLHRIHCRLARHRQHRDIDAVG
jgi:hypothetical protein